MFYVVLIEIFHAISGLFPFELATSVQRLKSIKSVPSKHLWENKLTGTTISDQDLEYVKYVWNLFGISSLFEYAQVRLYFFIHNNFNTELTF